MKTHPAKVQVCSTMPLAQVIGNGCPVHPPIFHLFVAAQGNSQGVGLGPLLLGASWPSASGSVPLAGIASKNGRSLPLLLSSHELPDEVAICSPKMGISAPTKSPTKCHKNQEIAGSLYFKRFMNPTIAGSRKASKRAILRPEKYGDFEGLAFAGVLAESTLPQKNSIPGDSSRDHLIP